jgi:hypothetical protein
MRRVKEFRSVWTQYDISWLVFHLLVASFTVPWVRSEVKPVGIWLYMA